MPCQTLRQTIPVFHDFPINIARSADRFRTPRILALAAGHLREVEFSAAVGLGAAAELVALDQDAESLEVIAQSYAHYPVQTVPASVCEVLAGRIDLGRFHLVYTAGLFDYLPPRVACKLTNWMVDGQRVAVLGPIALDVTYDARFQTDAYDAGLRAWTVQMDVLDVRAVGDEVPDMAWVQIEGEVIDRPRVFAQRYGDRREMIERYANVSLRCREAADDARS